MTLSISVVIPTYNAADTIVDTVTSVANQHYPPMEILVVDDCSTDETFLKLQFLHEEIPITTLQHTVTRIIKELCRMRFLWLLDKGYWPGFGSLCVVFDIIQFEITWNFNHFIKIWES